MTVLPVPGNHLVEQLQIMDYYCHLQQNFCIWYPDHYSGSDCSVYFAKNK